MPPYSISTWGYHGFLKCIFFFKLLFVFFLLVSVFGAGFMAMLTVFSQFFKMLVMFVFVCEDWFIEIMTGS